MTDFDPQEYVAQQREAAAKQRWHQARDRHSDAKMLARRAADPNDPVEEATARQAAADAEKAGKGVETLVETAGIKMATLVAEREATLRARKADWQRNLALHESYLNEPEKWDGVDLGGAEIVEADQAAAVQAYRTAVEQIDEELDELKSLQSYPKRKGGTDAE